MWCLQGATQDAAAAAASLQRLVMNLEFPGEGGLNRMMLNSMFNSTYTLSDWEKASKLAGYACFLSARCLCILRQVCESLGDRG